MPSYDPTPVIGASLEELRFIANFVREHEDRDNPRTVLIGGWAVHSYNDWYGSIDIDLITDTKGKKRLLDRLIGERHFERFRMDGDGRGIRRMVSSNQHIIIDLGTRNVPDPFEGGEGRISFDILDGRTVLGEVAGISIPVPERTLLLTFKLKAAWDRNYRTLNGTSHDPHWERGKLLKDRGDILALLDPDHGGREVRIDRLNEHMERWPALRISLTSALGDREAVRTYGRMGHDKVEDLREMITSLL